MSLDGKLSDTEIERLNNVKLLSDKEGMVTCLLSIVLTIGRKELIESDEFIQLIKLISFINPDVTRDEQDETEQLVFAMVAIKKYGITVKEAHQLVMSSKAIEFCFEKYKASPEWKNQFKGPDPAEFYPEKSRYKQ